ANVQRYPRRKRNQSVKDDKVLEWLGTLSTPLITTDTRMKTDHETDFPLTHPGLIVLATGKNSPLTTKGKLNVLSKLKSNIPNWELLEPINSIVEIWVDSEFDLVVSRACNGVVSNETRFCFATDGWEADLIAALKQNASGDSNSVVV